MISKPIRAAARRWQVAIATVSLWVAATQSASPETTKLDSQPPARNPMAMADLWIFEPAGPAERVTLPARVHLKNSKGDSIHPDRR